MYYCITPKLMQMNNQMLGCLVSAKTATKLNVATRDAVITPVLSSNKNIMYSTSFFLAEVNHTAGIRLLTEVLNKKN